MTIIEANKSSNSIMERMDLWFDTIKIKLNDVSNIINIDDLASKQSLLLVELLVLQHLLNPLVAFPLQFPLLALLSLGVSTPP